MGSHGQLFNNTVALMLDDCFKGMDCIMDDIGRDQVAILMQQYADLVAMPFWKCDEIFESRSSCRLNFSIARTSFNFN